MRGIESVHVKLEAWLILVIPSLIGIVSLKIISLMFNGGGFFEGVEGVGGGEVINNLRIYWKLINFTNAVSDIARFVTTLL